MDLKILVEIKDGDESISMLSESSLDDFSSAFEGMSLYADDSMVVATADKAPGCPVNALADLLNDMGDIGEQDKD